MKADLKFKFSFDAGDKKNKSDNIGVNGKEFLLWLSILFILVVIITIYLRYGR